MQRRAVKPGTPEAIVLVAIWDAVHCRLGVTVSWPEVLGDLVENGQLSSEDATEALKDLKACGYVLTGDEARAYCNDVRVGSMDVCVTEDGKAALDSLELALPSGL